MLSIPHLLNNIKILQNNFFKLIGFLDTLVLVNKTTDELDLLLNNHPEIFELIELCSPIIEKISNIITPIASECAKKEYWSKAHPIKQQPYAGFTIDGPPIQYNPTVQEREPTLDYKDLLVRFQEERGKPLKMIKRRKESSFQGDCPNCNAPNTYIYDNNGDKGQLMCKCCQSTFVIRKSNLEKITLKCPHCQSALEKCKTKGAYTIYKCRSSSCSFYLKNKHIKEHGTKEQRQKLKTNSNQDKLHYICRIFDINIAQLKKESPITHNTKVDLSKIHNSPHVLGLILTYYVNYSLSSRKTAAIMKDIHCIDITHQTVINYANSVAAIIEPYIEHYPYQLSNLLCGDETYIKVRGKTQYTCFISDAINKIITSYRVYQNRDSVTAIKTIYQTLKKYKQIPEVLTLITDGNPIYNAAQVFFNLEQINFELHQVIGVSNKDHVSKTWRPQKQITERLNRTFKASYSDTNGFDTNSSANAFMVLFSGCFNFLRPHSSLKYRVPVEVESIKNQPHMPAKWLELIQLSHRIQL